MDGFDKTMKFSIQDEKQSVHVNDVLLTVYDALQEKGYNPINQIVGYLLSGDPAYILAIKMHVASFASLNVMS